MSDLSRTAALALARSALSTFGIPGDAVLEFVKYRENVVFRVSALEDAYALRIHRHGHRSDDEVRAEIAYMQALHQAGLAVSEVVPTRAGELFATVSDGQGAPYQVDVQRWVPDSAPLGDCGAAWNGTDLPTVGTFAQLGEVCGRFHALSAEIGRLPGYSRPAWDLDGLVGPAPLWGDPRRLAGTEEDRLAIDAALRDIRRDLARIGTGPADFGVIHADFSPENVLLSRGRLTLIDFDDFGEGWWLFDLATVLFWYHRHPRYSEYRAALLNGYRKHFRISEQSLSSLDAFILARGLTYLGWAADRPESETSDFIRAEVLPVVTALCRTADGPARTEIAPRTESTA